MDNFDVTYESVSGEFEPPASLLKVMIRRRRSETPVYVPGFDTSEASFETSRAAVADTGAANVAEVGNADERGAGETDAPDVRIPSEPMSKAAPGVEALIDLWADQLGGDESLPRDIPIETVMGTWTDVFVLHASGWRGRRMELETKGRMSRGEIDLDPNKGPMAELMEMARRSVAEARPYHESVIFRTDTDEIEIGLLTLPLAANGKRPDRVLCHFYKV